MKSESVFIFDQEASEIGIARPTSARGGSDGQRVARAVEVSSEVMEANLTAFINTIADMLSKADAAEEAGMRMDTVNVSIQVGADGKFGFMGVGLSARASSTMTIVFKRA